MIALVQRVKEAGVQVEGQSVAAIGAGFLVFVCAQPGDTPEAIDTLAGKVARLRVCSDESGRMNKSLLDVGGEALVVSQFTLAADTRSGNRPSFSNAAPPEEGRRGYERFVEALKAQGVPVQTGIFGADMQVSLINDGPATFWLTR